MNRLLLSLVVVIAVAAVACSKPNPPIHLTKEQAETSLKIAKDTDNATYLFLQLYCGGKEHAPEGDCDWVEDSLKNLEGTTKTVRFNRWGDEVAKYGTANQKGQWAQFVKDKSDDLRVTFILLMIRGHQSMRSFDAQTSRRITDEYTLLFPAKE